MDVDTLLSPFEERYERIKELNEEQRKRLCLMVSDVEECVGVQPPCRLSR